MRSYEVYLVFGIWYLVFGIWYLRAIVRLAAQLLGGARLGPEIPILLHPVFRPEMPPLPVFGAPRVRAHAASPVAALTRARQH